MNASIVGKQFELTDSIKEYIESLLESLTKYNLDIISVRTVISADEKKGKKGFTVDFAINLAHLNTIVIKQKDKDLYAAIDLAIERAKKVFRREHDKNVSLKHKTSNEPKNDLPGDVVEELENADEIIPMELELYKPMEIEEALDILKNSDLQFFVFNDADAKMRVIYKKSEENRYGLY